MADAPICLVHKGLDEFGRAVLDAVHALHVHNVLFDILVVCGGKL